MDIDAAQSVEDALLCSFVIVKSQQQETLSKRCATKAQELESYLHPSGVCPPASEGCSQASRVCPLTSEVCPLTSEVCPLTSEVCPLTSRVCSLTSEVCPLASEVCPLTSEGCSQASEVSVNHLHARTSMCDTDAAIEAKRACTSLNCLTIPDKDRSWSAIDNLPRRILCRTLSIAVSIFTNEATKFANIDQTKLDSITSTTNVSSKILGEVYENTSLRNTDEYRARLNMYRMAFTLVITVMTLIRFKIINPKDYAY